jgi:hypothetical protein
MVVIKIYNVKTRKGKPQKKIFKEKINLKLII